MRGERASAEEDPGGEPQEGSDRRPGGSGERRSEEDDQGHDGDRERPPQRRNLRWFIRNFFKNFHLNSIMYGYLSDL